MFNYKLVIISILASLVVISSQNIAYSDVVSLESNYVAGQTDLVSKLNNDRTDLTNGVNNIRGAFTGSVQSSGQVKADTIGEENMADDANPRIRTAEGASCVDLVFEGFLPATTSGTLIGSIPAGTGYPDGFRIKKDTATAKTFTGTKWTYVDLNTSGSFVFPETVIGGSAPATSANSLRIARVSTDSTQLTNISDLRTTSCTSGPFDNISDAAGEATLDDILKSGSPVKISNSYGWIQGMQVSWDSHTTFLVNRGSAYINGKYRIASLDVTLSDTADDPAQGGSGIDTGSVDTDKTYTVYAIADQDTVKSLSITYSLNSTAPAGVTNARKLGSIGTDSSGLFTSSDIVLLHSVGSSETIKGWCQFTGNASTPVCNDGFNVSSITDGASGNYTIVWDTDFANANYATVCNADTIGTVEALICSPTTQTTGSVVIDVITHAGSQVDSDYTSVIAIGDQ